MKYIQFHCTPKNPSTPSTTILAQDVRALFRAVADSEAVGLEPEELDEAKQVLEEAAAVATKVRNVWKHKGTGKLQKKQLQLFF